MRTIRHGKKMDLSQTLTDKGKPMVVMVCHYTTDNSILYKLYPVRDYQDEVWARICCDRIEGSDYILYARIADVSRADYIRVFAHLVREGVVI